MLKKFIKECLEQAKEDYFETDHHYHAGQNAKDAEWTVMLTSMDRDFYDEWIDPVINTKDPHIWGVANRFMLYMFTKEVIEELYNHNANKVKEN